MFFIEHNKKLNDLYTQLEDLKEARRVIQNAIHNNFYNRTVADGLYNKLQIVNERIKKLRLEIKEEKKNEQR